jgi:hypothetical protein
MSWLRSNSVSRALRPAPGRLVKPSIPSEQKRSKRSRTVCGWQRRWQAISPVRRPSQRERDHLGALFAIMRGVVALGQLTDLGGFVGVGRGAGLAEFGHRNPFPPPAL